MRSFCFIDKVSEVKEKESLTAFFTLKGDEEFLKDHFEGFPVMPGVLLLEALKQAACALLDASSDGKGCFYRLSEATDVKYGQFVKPGSLIRIAVRSLKSGGGPAEFEGRIDLMKDGAPAGRALLAAFRLEKVQTGNPGGTHGAGR